MCSVKEDDVNPLIRQFNVMSDLETLGHTLHGLIEHAASRHANKTALICANSQLTFTEVNERANGYAHSLIKQGIGRGDIVGVALDRSIDLVPMLLAVLKTGAVYIPIDPSLPAQRICQMLTDSHPKLVVADAGPLDFLASWQGACLTIDQLRDTAISECNGCNPTVDVQPQDLAYIMYTSGSTGKPKGVEISHEAVCNTLLSTKREPGCHDADRMLAISTICFDMAVLELFLPLISGATTIIAQRSEVREMEALQQLLRRYSITMMCGTPSTWQILLDSGWQGKPRLKKMISSGETLSNGLAERLLTCGDGLWNLYGATEAAVYTTVWRVRRDEDVIIGSPIPNNQLYVLDTNLSLVPLGGSGEVYIGGAGVGRGYHNNAALTESCFLNNPFDEGKLYRTGDLGRFIAPGKVCILGRSDGQVKIRGHRIEVGDIEACISSHENISGVAVINLDGRLIACCVRRLHSDLHESGNLAAPALGHFLRPWIAERVPGYMMPAFFVELQSFPLSPNGKIDRKTLLDTLPMVEAAAQTKSGNKLEREILAIWSKVLGHDKIALDVNFFHIGGDSLRVVRVQKELERLSGRWISSAKMFEHNTIKALAEYLGGRNEAIQDTPVAGLVTTGQNGIRHSHGSEDIAIISMACRLPGGIATPEEYWELLVNGRDATTDVPKDRWDADAIYDADPNASGKSYCRRGGFITSPPINSFDASFFGISPREAREMDPTQAVMLETCWEGFERAGYTTEQLRGSRTGVFIGSSTIGAHSISLHHSRDLAALDGYATTGTAGSVLSGRVSYVLGLQGPNLTVDTACSSSLVATHLACNALRQGECDMAISGGVSLLLGPGLYVEFSRLRGMSADGRCRAFAADTQGTGWAEGCAAVVLKRLSDAQRDGDVIHAILRGTAVNHDGQSASLTTPSGPAQKQLVLDALGASGLQPRDIDYIEAHGTATKLGDPIEGMALAEVFKDGRVSTTEPLWIGSAKSNIGHTQAAAGLAGLLKVVLSMQNQTLPRSLHVNEPTPEIDWEGANMSPVQTTRPWLLHGGSRPRRAGVSAFGIGGTNAHVIVEEALVRNVSELAPLTPLPHEMPFLLSGQSDGALREQADNLHRHLSDTTDGLQDVAFSLATTRNHFRRRLAIMARDKRELLEKLSRVARPLDDSSVSVSDPPTTAKPCLAMLFTGQGSQLLGISRALYENFPAFREALDKIAAMFAPMLDKPLLDILLADKKSNEAADLLKRTDFAQPCLFALEVSLWRLWQSWGVQPDFLLGHSAGELSIAHVAGILDLADACQLVAARGRLMQSLPSRGSMISLEVGAMDVTAAIMELGLKGKVDIACENTPQQTVASGDSEAIKKMEAYFTQRNRKAKILEVSHAFHSFQMDEMLEEFRAVVETIQFHPAKIPIVSSVTGEVARQGELETSNYWVQQVRKTVLFSSAAKTLTREGANIFLELGPEPILCGMAAACLSDSVISSAKSMVWLPSLVHNKDAVSTIHKSLLGLHMLHIPIEWSGYFEPFRCRKISLPTYAFQRQQIMPMKGLFVDNISVTSCTHHRQAMDVRDIEQCLFQINWHPASINTIKPCGSWGIMLSHGEVTWMRDVTEALTQSGMKLVQVNGIRDAEQLDGLVCLWGSNDGALQATRELTANALSQLQDAVHMGFSLPIVWITRHAIAINPEDQVDGLGAAALWGLMRTARSESPELRLRLMDIDDQDITLDALPYALMLETEPECALRHGNVAVPRIQQVKPVITKEKPVNKPLLRPDGAVLMTGGMGGIGRHVVKWLAGTQGIRDIVLLSRRGMASPGAETIVSDLARLGAKVTVVAGDVGDANCVEKTLALFDDNRPLRGVFHAAGVLDDGLLSGLTPQRCGVVFGPKIDGAWNLHRFTRGMHLDVFVMFSSISGVIGTIGQANYAAANTFLDALAHLRRAENLPATSIAWGSWSGDGMAAELNDMCLAYHAQLGLETLSPEQGLDLLDLAIRGRNPFAIAAKYNLERLRKYYQDASGIPPLFQLLLGRDSKQDEKRRGCGLELRHSLKGASLDEREAIILGVVRTAVAKILGFASPDHVDVDVPLQKIGIDSLATVLIRNQLTATLSLSVNISFNHESLRALSQSLLAHVRGSMTSGHEAISGTVVDTTTNSHSNTREASVPRQLIIANRSINQTLPSELVASDPILVSSLDYFSSLLWCSSLIKDYSPSSGLLPGYGQAITFMPRCFSPPSPEHDQFFRHTLSEQNNNGAIRHALSLFRPSDSHHLEDTSRPIMRVATLFALGRYTSGHKGIVHGGLIATLLDESLGIVSQVNTAFKKSGFHCTDIYVTGSLNIRFLAPLTTHEDVVCLTAWVENIQSRNIALKAKMTNSIGKTLAMVDSLWIAVDEGQSAG